MHEDAYPADLLHGMFAKLNALGVCDEPPADLYDHGMSDFYDGFMAEYVADIPVFEKLAPPGAKVLDLACGAGRIGFALARLGYTVDGLELSPAMLELAAANAALETPEVRGRVRFVRGDMTGFDMGERYDLVIVGITSISLLLDPEQRVGLFRSVAGNLAQDGVFVFDTLDLEDDKWRKLDHFHDVWSVSTSGEFDIGIVGQRFYPAERRFIFNVYRETGDWDGNVHRRLGYSEKAWFTREQLAGELDAAGLIIRAEQLFEDQRFFIVGHRGESR
ncbi:class I SAM-dependent methyltransferase [Sphingomonas kyeonggiensis]|uniref:class I SAM-dependent methyltransferase n=1 Tax=Sphingomonas kyeonggiensis TaxID=1268553 RepID=UPI0027D8AD1B|nr:class I SAM-dependent methyltransferase [Sphingomonas kyeonggiensis]